MQLDITLHADEIDALARELLPVRVLLGGEGDVLQWVEVFGPREVTFLPGRGIRVACSATIHYPLPVLPDEVKLDDVRLVLEPRTVETPAGRAIAFYATLEELDVNVLPQFVDHTIMRRVNEQLRARTSAMAWNFTSLLSKRLDLPDRVVLVDGVALQATEGRVRVDDRALTITVWVSVALLRDVTGPLPAEPPPSRETVVTPPR